MELKGWYTKLVLGAIAVALLKLAFFPAGGEGVVPRAFAQSAAIEWKDSRRIVTAGNEGATTYVWDYDDKTKVRRYTIKGDKLTLESFKLDE
jgi:predicted lipoprotein with Yx(FWY)xxD motif